MASKIYIAPSYGNKEGQLLVFDTVESMTHIKTSRVPQHPVEAINRSSADHRYREGVKIQIVGMVSDNWITSIKEEPTPQFKTSTDKFQKNIRLKLEQEFQEDTNNEIFLTINDYELVSEVVQKILDKKEVPQKDFDDAKAISPFWVIMSKATVEREKDEVALSLDKQLKNSQNTISNSYTMEEQNSTITQAKELLNDIDENNILCTIMSMFEVYDNMILTSFNNPLRNGPQRGGYWVSLTFEEQIIATTTTKKLVVDSKESEAANSKKDRGKQEPVVIDKGDTKWKELEGLWDEQLRRRDAQGEGPKIRKFSKVVTNGKTAKERVLEEVYRVYVSSSSEKEMAKQQASFLISGRMGDILGKQGKL
jgi:hypothetical protein